MTRILRCDRCKNEVVSGGDPDSPKTYYDLYGWETFMGFDICPECMKAFKRDFMGQKEPVDGCQRTLDGADEPWNSSVSITEPSPSGTVTYTVDDLMGKSADELVDEIMKRAGETQEALMGETADKPSEGML